MLLIFYYITNTSKVSGIVKLFGVLKSQAVKKNNYSKKRYFLLHHFIFLTSILRAEDWILQFACHIIQQICDLKQDSEVSDILMYSSSCDCMNQLPLFMESGY